jgi:hypothetical protein
LPLYGTARKPAISTFAKNGLAKPQRENEAMAQVTDMVETLEKLVDSQQDGLLHVLTALEIMCGEKAAHIVHNWQDRDTARPWRSAEGKLGKLAHEIEKLGI